MGVETPRLILIPVPGVLFPHARQRLNLHEQRYLALLRLQAQLQIEPGLVLILPATEQQAAGHARIGTEVAITDFGTRTDGNLELVLQAQRRFRILNTRPLDAGLLIGEVRWLPPEPAMRVPVHCAALQTLAQEILQHPGLAQHLEPDLEDASSLGNLLASLLVLQPTEAQALLEMTDPLARLEALVSLLGQNPDG